MHLMFRSPVLAGALFLLAPSTLQAQDSSLVRSACWGAMLGFSGYTYQSNEVAVHPETRTSGVGGVTWLLPVGKQGFIKLGIEVTDYRSPFDHDTSYYDLYSQFPVLIRIADLARFGPHSRLVCSLGPRFSFLLEQGVAGRSDENYAMRSSSFFGVYKTGLVAEFTVYNAMKSGQVQFFGIRGSADLNGWSARLGPDDLAVKDRYSNVTLFYSLTFGK